MASDQSDSLLDPEDRKIVEQMDRPEAINREIRAHEAFIERRKLGGGDPPEHTEKILAEHEELLGLLKERLAEVTGIGPADPANYS